VLVHLATLHCFLRHHGNQRAFYFASTTRALNRPSPFTAFTPFADLS
jgi:hypothetical protein